MGVSMQEVNQGLLDLNKIISSGMDAWDRVAKSTRPPTTVPATGGTTTPAVTPGAQTTQQAGGGLKISGTMLVIGLGVVLAFAWRRRG